MANRRNVIKQARQIFRTAETALEALSDERVESAEGLESMRPEAADSSDARRAGRSPGDPAEGTAVARAMAEERARHVRNGIEAMKKVELGRDDEITPREQAGLEAIVLLTGRPAILIQDGAFIEPPKIWSQLKEVRQAIEAVIGRVGRIEVSGHPEFEWLGTGFLAGPTTVITNRHVAMEFARTKPKGGWTFRKPMAAAVDFKAEFGSNEALEFKVTDILGIHDEHDMAVLKVSKTSGRASLSEPVSVAVASPKALKGRKVYVVGYPAWDGRRNDPAPMRDIFAEIYNVKRLQPGEISGATLSTFAIQHDCSTLGGNSGSPVVDLETHRVLGLHFGGRFMVNNNAVPLWLLRNDPLVKRAKLNFQ